MCIKTAAILLVFNNPNRAKIVVTVSKVYAADCQVIIRVSSTNLNKTALIEQFKNLNEL